MFYTDKKSTDVKNDPNMLACLQGYFIVDIYRVLYLICIISDDKNAPHMVCYPNGCEEE